MKTRKFIWSLPIAAVLLALVLTSGVAQPKKPRPGREFMLEKLELSQKVLEGLTLEDYDLILAKSQKLGAMSQAAGWRVFENPEYVQFSATFRHNIDDLVKAAKARNVDGATLAYLRMTMTCVECHKYVRGRLLASARCRATDKVTDPLLSRPAATLSSPSEGEEREGWIHETFSMALAPGEGDRGFSRATGVGSPGFSRWNR